MKLPCIVYFTLFIAFFSFNSFSCCFLVSQYHFLFPYYYYCFSLFLCFHFFIFLHLHSLPVLFIFHFISIFNFNRLNISMHTPNTFNGLFELYHLRLMELMRDVVGSFLCQLSAFINMYEPNDVLIINYYFTTKQWIKWTTKMINWARTST